MSDQLGYLLWELPSHACRWPIAEGEDGHLFCGAEKLTCKSYCKAHHAQATYKRQPSTARRKPVYEPIKPVRRVDYRWQEWWQAPVK